MSHSLGKAANDNDLFEAAFLFPAQGLLDGLECFKFSGLYETAGINDNDVSLSGIGEYYVCGLCNFGEHSLGIDCILGTAEADESYGDRSVFWLLHETKVSETDAGIIFFRPEKSNFNDSG